MLYVVGMMLLSQHVPLMHGIHIIYLGHPTYIDNTHIDIYIYIYIYIYTYIYIYNLIMYDVVPASACLRLVARAVCVCVLLG